MTWKELDHEEQVEQLMEYALYDLRQKFDEGYITEELPDEELVVPLDEEDFTYL